MHDDAAQGIEIRRARTGDVPGIQRLIDLYAPSRRLLAKPTVALYEDVQEFRVAANGSGVVGCGALHVLWRDLAEIRTVAVDPASRGLGLGRRIVEALLGVAGEIGIRRVFVLTFEVDFFTGRGFVPLDDVPIDRAVYAELLRSHDEGVEPWGAAVLRPSRQRWPGS